MEDDTDKDLGTEPLVMRITITMRAAVSRRRLFSSHTFHLHINFSSQPGAEITPHRMNIKKQDAFY